MTETLAQRRARLLGPNVPTFYREPVEIVRGEGVWLWDAEGRRYLDAYNNVPHVGHCHPHVVEAICRQASTLNTHSRYLHGLMLDYAERLTATLADGPWQMLWTCTGSEANDVALRMARAATGRTGIIATDTTYHGNTEATAALSTRRPPIGGRPPHVRLVPAPDSRRPLGGSLAAQPEALAEAVRAAIADLDASGHGLAGFMLCPVFANEGLPALAPGDLASAVAAVRAAGGLILCDEVQPGLGRTGSHFWGHQWLGIAPDVVTVGKPMGNGYPVAAALARAEVMAAFRAAFGYFNTFAGSPVAAAAAMAVLDVLEQEALQANAAATGAHLHARLAALDHPAIAEIRALGLFFGVVLETADGAPATGLAEAAAEGMRRRGVLLHRIGRDMNILKLRPPMPFGRDHADLAADTLAAVLEELGND